MKCLFRHKWLSRVNERRCRRCGKFQRYTIVDAGRRKIWLTFREPIAPTHEGGSDE